MIPYPPQILNNILWACSQWQQRNVDSFDRDSAFLGTRAGVGRRSLAYRTDQLLLPEFLLCFCIAFSAFTADQL